jgi:hypothetical protein
LYVIKLRKEFDRVMMEVRMVDVVQANGIRRERELINQYPIREGITLTSVAPQTKHNPIITANTDHNHNARNAASVGKKERSNNQSTSDPLFPFKE